MATPQEIAAAATRLQQESDKVIVVLTESQTKLVDAQNALAAALAANASQAEVVAAGEAMLATVNGVITAIDPFTPDDTPLPEVTARGRRAR